MKRKALVISFLTFALFGGTVGYWKLTSAPPSPKMADAPPANPESKPETEEDKTRRKLLGVWQDEYKGKRTMTLNEDGTGTMLVELSGLQATLFASKLRFDMKWSLEGKTLTKKTVGGEPADKVNLILNTMGNQADDTILECNDDQLLLLDKDGVTKYDWRRVKEEEGHKAP
jgi:hypothetical protein